MGLNDSVHAVTSSGQRGSAYIPPHLRPKAQAHAQASNTGTGSPAATNGTLERSQWASAPAPAERFVPIKLYNFMYATGQRLTLDPAISNASRMVGVQRLNSPPQATGTVPDRALSVHSILRLLQDTIAEQHQEKVVGVMESTFREHQTLAWNATFSESQMIPLSRPQGLILKNTMTFPLRRLEQMSRRLLRHSPLPH